MVKDQGEWGYDEECPDGCSCLHVEYVGEDKCKDGYHHGPDDAGGGMVGGGDGVGDHKKCKEEKGAVGHEVDKVVGWPAEPKDRTGELQGEVGAEEGDAGVDAADFEEDDESSDTYKIKGGEAAAPLTVGDPGVASEEGGEGDADVDGVKDVLAVPAEPELA